MLNTTVNRPNRSGERTTTSVAGRILIVEDEVQLLNHLARTLGDQGYSVFTCDSYRDLETMLALPVKRFDVIILDRLLHTRDSAGLLDQIRAGFHDARIMVLSAIGTSAEKARLLEEGADDYLSKPFDSSELIARVRVLLRRGKAKLQLGNLVLDSEQRALKVGGLEVPLTNKEFVLLRTLVQTPGKIFSKAFLYQKVWDMSAEVESNVVEVTVNKLRRRLKDAGAMVQIRNMRHSGYWVEE